MRLRRKTLTDELFDTSALRRTLAEQKLTEPGPEAALARLRDLIFLEQEKLKKVWPVGPLPCILIPIALMGVVFYFWRSEGIAIATMFFMSLPNLSDFFQTRHEARKKRLLALFVEQAKKATLPSAAGPILDVLALTTDDRYTGPLREALLPLLERGDSESAAALTVSQRLSLSNQISGTQSDELNIAALLTLAATGCPGYGAISRARMLSARHGSHRVKAAARELLRAAGYTL